jgi:hypothetical protein
LQTAAGAATGEHADAAIPMVTTAFNLAIFAAGAVGAVFVDGVGAKALPAVMIAFAAVALIAVRPRPTLGVPPRPLSGSDARPAPSAHPLGSTRTARPAPVLAAFVVCEVKLQAQAK